MRQYTLSSCDTGLYNEIIHFKYFSIFLSLFSATWLLSNIAAIKFVQIFSITLTGGFIIFPITSMLSSIIVEVYGYKNVRQAIWAGVILNLSFIFFIYLIYLLPSSNMWDLNEEFKAILLPSMRVAAASVMSFITAEFVNSFLMAKMKIFYRGNSLVKRILIACVFSFLLDISLFLFLAFYKIISNAALLKLIAWAYLKKILSQLALLPVAIFIIDWVKKIEKVDVYDYGTAFNPFSLDSFYDLKRCDMAHRKYMPQNEEVIMA